MKTTWILQLCLIALVLGCTQGRERDGNRVIRSQYTPSNAEPIAQVQFNGATTQVLQMTAKRGALYVTGKPFGFSTWDISADPENPQQIGLAMSQHIEEFSPIGKWIVDYYASGAIGLYGGFSIVSGTAGSSIISLGSEASSHEVLRYPPLQGDGISSDQNYVYRGIATDITEKYVFGFRLEGFAKNWTVGSGGGLIDNGTTPYSSNGNTVCCALGATSFAKKIFVAMKTRMWVFDVDQNGRLANLKEMPELQAINVQASARLLYVQHETVPSVPGSTSKPSGIYVYDENGNSINFLPVTPLAFAVSEDDRYLYANMDDESITIYRIRW